MEHLETSSYRGLADQYLHTAMRLFMAASGIRDPLIRGTILSTKACNERKNLGAEEDCEIALDAIKTAWNGQEILSSREFLKHLFDLKQVSVTVDTDTNGSICR